MPWTLRFPYDTVDARVFVRQSISEMRRDPAVTDVQLNPALPRSAWFDTLLVQVEFLEGHDQPADAVLADRLLAFRPRREPPTPWPYDPPVPEDDEDEQRPRLRGMTLNFERIYGRLDRPNENGDHFTPELRQQLIQQYLGNPEVRQRLAASFANPIRRNRDYQAIGRRTFLVEQIPDGALPVYDRDPLPGAMTTIHAGHDLRFDAPGFVLPDWVQPGAFARFKWADSGHGYMWGSSGGGTATLTEWNKTLKRAPGAKLACIDVQAYTSSQVPDRPGILNVGGWSDEVFNVLKAFVEGEGQWVQMIENAP